MTRRAYDWEPNSYAPGSPDLVDTALDALVQASVHVHSGGRLADIGCASG